MAYLFSWDDVFRKDYAELLLYLRDDLNIGWAENDDAKIITSNGGKTKTIRIFKDKNSVTIKIVEKKGIATLKIRNGETHKLTVKKDNGKLKIYDLIIHKHSIVEIGGLEILRFSVIDLGFVLISVSCLYIAIVLKLEPLMSIIAACMSLALMSFVKIYRFNRSHKKVPKKIDMDNLHDEVIEFLVVYTL